MEIREYWAILKRWRWIAVLPAICIAAIGLITRSPVPHIYTTTIRFSASVPPTYRDPEEAQFDTAYHAWITSEYFVASLSDWVKTEAFARSVSDKLESQDIDLHPATIQNGLASDYVRSQLVLSITSGSHEHLIATARAATDVLQTQNASIFPQLGGQNAPVIPLDEPMPQAAPISLRSQIYVALRIGLGIGVGLMLASLAHYLDPMLRTRDDVERLSMEIIAEIPPTKDW